ncbi:MAG: MarR family transcriptional regulator, partial [Candidatus Thiodiazotropha sp.]
MKLTPVMEKYILHWGEMGTRWGVNRTVAQIQALLFLSSNPMNAEEITETLGVARSNVSTSIKELQSWRLIKVVHLLGDRRDHFETLKDP